jgi:hypothetical protein
LARCPPDDFGLRDADYYLRRVVEAVMIRWINDNAEAIVLAGVMGILWFFMMVA